MSLRLYGRPRYHPCCVSWSLTTRGDVDHATQDFEYEDEDDEEEDSNTGLENKYYNAKSKRACRSSWIM